MATKKRNNVFIRLYKEAIREPLAELREGLKQLKKCASLITQSSILITKISIMMTICSMRALWCMSLAVGFETWTFGIGLYEERKNESD